MGNVQKDGRDLGDGHPGFFGVSLVLLGKKTLAEVPRGTLVGATDVQPDAADGADFLLCQRRQNAADDGGLARRLTGVEHRLAAEHLDLDILALADGSADVDRAVDGLADEDLAVVALGHEPDEA